MGQFQKLPIIMNGGNSGLVYDITNLLVFHSNDQQELQINFWIQTCRVEIGGIMPPVDRPENLFFDPGAKYHIVSNTGYMRCA